MHDPVDDSEREQRERQPDEDLLGDLDRIDGHDDDDRGGDECAEQRAQRDRDDRRPAEGRNGLGEAGMMDRARILRIVRCGIERDALRRGIAAG